MFGKRSKILAQDEEIVVSRTTVERLVDEAMSRFGLWRHWIEWAFDEY